MYSGKIAVPPGGGGIRNDNEVTRTVIDYFYILLIRINKDITHIRYVKKINELTNKFKFINYVCTTVKKHTKSKNFLKNKTAIFF
jgi:hypothetical protein